MRKSEIEKLSRQPQDRAAKRIAPYARGEQPCKRLDGETIDLSRETIDALADAVAAAVVARLKELLPVCARVSAADTVHTVQRPESVLRDAVKEGRLAADIIKGVV